MLTQESAPAVVDDQVQAAEVQPEAKPEIPPEAELQMETQEIIRELVGDYGMFIESLEEEDEDAEDPKKLEEKVKKLHADASVWRSQALYRVPISIHGIYGASTMRINFEDIVEVSGDLKKALQKSQVKSTIPVSQGIKQLRNKLYGFRQRLIDKHYKMFGEEWVVPQENFQAVLDGIKELFALLETEKQKALNTSRRDLRVFLTTIGRLCDANGFTGERKRKILTHHRKEFPTADDIRRIYIVVGEPEEIPSYKSIVAGDNELAQAAASREEAETRMARERAEREKIESERRAVQELRNIARKQIEKQWSETYERLNTGFLTIVEQQLAQLMSDRSTMDGNQRREFSRALQEMQNFLVGGDQSLQELMSQVEGLGEFIEGTENADARRRQLDQRIAQIREQFSEKFESLKISGKGHRLRALENFSLTDI